MKIVEDSVHDITDEFEVLKQGLQGCNYVVALEGRRFLFTQDDNFTMATLGDLYHEYYTNKCWPSLIIHRKNIERS